MSPVFYLALALATPEAAEVPACTAPDVAVQVVDEGILEAKTTRLGTNLQLGISGAACEKAVEAFRSVYAEFDRLEQLVDDGEGSNLARVNAAAGGAPVEVPKELLELISTALDFAKKTDGAFDPTFAAMKGLWKFDGSDLVPSEADVTARRALVDYTQVKLDRAKNTVGLAKAGMRLELGGIAKGYAVDRAVSLLRGLGLNDFVVRSGGELFISGNPGGGYRRVGIPDPRGDGPFALVDVRDRAINISADNSRFFLKDGVRYHDRIDPKTGKPATRSRVAAVVCTDATTADALSTAIFIMGAEKGLALVEKMSGVEAILVDAGNTVHMSSGIDRGRFELRAPTP